MLLSLFPSSSEAAQWKVCASGCANNNSQLQTVLNSVAPGDEVLLQENFPYVGLFKLRANVGGRVTIRTGVTATGTVIPTSAFPQAGTRILPADSVKLAKFQTNLNNAPSLSTVKPGETGSLCSATPCVANNYTLQYLEWIPNTYAGGVLLRLGSNDTSGSVPAGDTQNLRAEVPSGFILDHVYIHGDKIYGQFRGIENFATGTQITDSYISDIKSLGEGQAIYSNNSEGGLTITNTFVEGNGENIISGGDTPRANQTVTVSAATSNSVTVSAVTDLQVGQGFTCKSGTTFQIRKVSAINGLVITPNTPFNVTPDVAGGSCNWGIVMKNFTLTKSHLYKNPNWRNAILDTPTNVSAKGATTGGTLVAGTYAYRVVARMDVAAGGIARSAASLEVTATIASGTTGSVQIQWDPVVNAKEYRIYGRSAGGENVRFTVTAPTATFTDTGSTGTTEAVPTTSGTKWFAKNLLEFKHYDGILVEGNIIEYSWKDGQNGPCVLFTPLNSSFGNDSTIVANAVFKNNIVRHCAQAIQITGHDASASAQLSQRLENLTIENNIFDDIGSQWGVVVQMIIVTSIGDPTGDPREGPKNLIIRKNLFNATGNNQFFAVDLGNGGVDYRIEGFQFYDNILRRTSSGFQYIKAPGGFQTEGNTSLALTCGSFTPCTFSPNVIAKASCSLYPAGNFCPDETTFQAQFVNYAGSDFTLAASSLYLKSASDGGKIGPNVAAITALTNIALSGNNTGVIVIPPDPGGGGGGPIVTPPNPPVITSPNILPGVLAGQAYNNSSIGYCLSSTSGTVPYVYSLDPTANILPTGLSLVNGCISGTPTVVGNYNFKVIVTDKIGQTGTKDFLIAVTQIIYPERRPDAFNKITERGTFAREVCPDGTTEEIKLGDFCFDLTNQYWTYASATSPSVVWSRVALSNNAGATYIFVSPNANFAMGLTAGGTQFTSSQDLIADLSGKTECKMFARSTAVADGTLWIRYSTDFTTTATDLGTTADTVGVSLASPVDSFVVTPTWQPIAEGAKTVVRLGFWGRSPSGTSASNLRNIGLICR